MTLPNTQQASSRLVFSPLAVIVWSVTLLASTLPDALGFMFLGAIPSWLFSAKILLLCLFLLLCFAWQEIKPLRIYFSFLLLNVLAWGLLPVVRSTTTWSSWEGQVPWSIGMLGIQVLKLCVALLTLVGLVIVMKHRADFFLVKGKLDALAGPVRWLGIDKNTNWKTLGPIIALAAGTIMLGVLLLTNPFPISSVIKALPLLPLVLLLSASNALNEEISYRCGLLAPLEPVLGKEQSILLVAVFFGFAHYAGGVPLATLPTILMTGFLGWLMGKSLLETRGLTWPWFIHFVNDIPVFAFLALGYVNSIAASN